MRLSKEYQAMTEGRSWGRISRIKREEREKKLIISNKSRARKQKGLFYCFSLSPSQQHLFTILA